MENKNLAPHEPVVREGGPTPSNATAEPAAAHTPGPWSVSAGSIWATSQWGARVRIAPVDSHSPMNGIDSAANARLIAAAPDLLAAAKYLMADLKHSYEPRVEALDKLEAAIAKATGADQ